jgi:hypothetical protein
MAVVLSGISGAEISVRISGCFRPGSEIDELTSEKG